MKIIISCLITIILLSNNLHSQTKRINNHEFAKENETKTLVRDVLTLEGKRRQRYPIQKGKGDNESKPRIPIEKLSKRENRIEHIVVDAEEFEY